MFPEGLGHADRSVGQLSRVAPRAVVALNGLNTALDLADVFQIGVQAAPIGLPKPLAEARHGLLNMVENAAVFAASGGTLFRGPAGAEQPLEDHTGIAFHRQRSRRRRPRNRVAVDAAVAESAGGAERARVLNAQLHGRQRRVLTELLRVDLIDGRTAFHIGAFGHLRMGAGEVDGGRSRVVRAFFLRVPGARAVQVGIADDRDVFAIGLQRHQGRGEFEIGAFFGRRPVVQFAAGAGASGGAVHHLNGAETRARGCRRLFKRRLRRRHSVEKRQRKSRTRASQQRPSRNMFPSDVHVSVPIDLIWFEPVWRYR